jgi:hypothetical protein
LPLLRFLKHIHTYTHTHVHQNHFFSPLRVALPPFQNLHGGQQLKKIEKNRFFITILIQYLFLQNKHKKQKKANKN